MALFSMNFKFFKSYGKIGTFEISLVNFMDTGF
jgi:hypothetical protein